ncbi:NAD(P)-binding protein [Byssothecium circinans]|uniref:NAD(P)-binding protein n=1 Tax=Byssothecium circinans TaxID=147558 RepID=A0A6A5TS72_9PLEO|nr:NAD(P)-binding protein [Byssothecium circinans]
MLRNSVLIVGANRGIGLSLANLYSQKGWEVFGTYRHISKDDAVDTFAAKTFELDLLDEKSINEAGASFGSRPLNLLINCAGIGPNPKSFEETTAQELEESLASAVVGPFLTTKTFLPMLRQAKDPKVVNITSNMGSISDNTSGGRLAYRVSRAAQNQLSRTIAKDFEKEGIVCIALHPGWIKTRLSNFSGHMGPDEAAGKLIAVIDGAGMDQSGRFWHRDGQELTW